MLEPVQASLLTPSLRSTIRWVQSQGTKSELRKTHLHLLSADLKGSHRGTGNHQRGIQIGFASVIGVNTTYSVAVQFHIWFHFLSKKWTIVAGIVGVQSGSRSRNRRGPRHRPLHTSLANLLSSSEWYFRNWIVSTDTIPVLLNFSFIATPGCVEVTCSLQYEVNRSAPRPFNHQHRYLDCHFWHHDDGNGAYYFTHSALKLLWLDVSYSPARLGYQVSWTLRPRRVQLHDSSHVH